LKEEDHLLVAELFKANQVRFAQYLEHRETGRFIDYDNSVNNIMLEGREARYQQ
jgi:hypothetical protein